MKSSAMLLSLGATILLMAVVVQAQPVIIQQPENQTVAVGADATFSVSVSGNGPFTYQWQLNGTNLPAGTISTVAGNGIDGYSGDGGAATDAAIIPAGVAVDASGNLFIADWGNNRIRKVSTSGIITTVAGKSTGGYSGDGGTATNTTLSSPTGVALDANGNLFIADWGNNRIRKVFTNGIITTMAGIGINGYSGDGGAATNAAIRSAGVAVDTGGNLFIADWGNNRIRKVSTSGIITTVAGNGINGYSGDGGTATNAVISSVGVAVDASGNLFIADTFNCRIRKVFTNGIITTVAGNGIDGYSGDGGAATNAALSFFAPSGVAMDANGNLFIADGNNHRIRKVSTNGIITTVAGNGTYGYNGDGGAANNTALYSPRGVAVDFSGNLFIADLFNYRIRKVDNSAIQPTFVLRNVSNYFVSYNYSVIVSSSEGSVTSNVASLTVMIPPTITSPPASLNNYAGSTVTFYVGANGDALAYQWFKNAALISGAVLPTLTLPNVQDADAAAYTVVITNLMGSITSSPPATLTVNDTLLLTVQPQSQTLGVGGNVTFSATVYGADPLVFQWYFNNKPIGSAGIGSHVLTCTLTNVQANQYGNYSVEVINGYGSVTSSNAVLSAVVFPPSVGLHFLAGYPLLNLNGMASSNFTVQYSTNLAGTNWINLRSISNLQTIPYQFLDPAGIVPPGRFYRALMQ